MQAVDEEIVHHAEDVVVHPLPHRGGDDGGDGPGHEHRRANAAPATEIGMDHQGDRESEDRLDGDRDDRKDDGIPDRGAERVFLQQVDVIGETDVARYRGLARTVFVKLRRKV